MACPYFYPLRRREYRRAILPLGDDWDGECRAGAPAEPGPEQARGACSFGYARGKCPRFPEGGGADAVRFSVASHGGGIVRIRYALERDHLPFGHGALDYSLAANVFLEPHPAATLDRQARAYLESYLRRKNLPS
jgi:hypothetical protein